MATEQTALAVTLTQALARVDEAEIAGLWPSKLQPPQKRLLAQATLAYGLDPLMQELTVFQGKPLVTIRGRRRKDAAAGHHPSIRFRFLTQEEKTGFTEAGAFHEGDLVMYCILTTEEGNTVEGVGKVTSAERTATSARSQDPKQRAHPIVDDNPIEMCQKRAEDRARMMAFGPIPVPMSFTAEVLSEYQMGESAPADAAQTLPEQSTTGYYCSHHNTAFQRRDRDGKVWYSHRIEGGAWCNMNPPPQEALPGAAREIDPYLAETQEPPPGADEVFDPETAPPPALPAHVTTMTHFEAVLTERGWDMGRFQADVLKTPLATYLRAHSLDQAYQAFKAHLTKR